MTFDEWFGPDSVNPRRWVELKAALRECWDAAVLAERERCKLIASAAAEGAVRAGRPPQVGHYCDLIVAEIEEGTPDGR